ncbi:MAG: hydroxymethylglutaryl-CoA reductase, degradative [Myxococcota bacterium]|jgi:hydroxymethylglutaryl-CoA reductase|nr:hydroxymethylglutaryl-CoA reductase, degradative [Myxococcota bacterium]
MSAKMGRTGQVPNRQEIDSRLPAFHRLSVAQRRERLLERSRCSPSLLEPLFGASSLEVDTAELMLENVLGVYGLPLGVCTNLRVNGQDRLVAMVSEEPSVVAAASHAAKMLRDGEGILSRGGRSLMRGQIQILELPADAEPEKRLAAHQARLLALANAQDPALCRAGGGALALELRRLEVAYHEDELALSRPRWEQMTIVELLVDVLDAMGANAINTMVEALAPELERLLGGRALLRILSNRAEQRLVKVHGELSLQRLGEGVHCSAADLAERIEAASLFAEWDEARAVTHNKGIMNGIDAVLMATGQDWRAVEAAAHAWAARSGGYRALSRWRVRGDKLIGSMELPLAVGIVGGALRVHPTARAALHLAEVHSARELAELAAAVGLAQNLAALRALADEGIQRGHMKLHRRTGPEKVS